MALFSIFGNLQFSATYSHAARTHGVQFDVSQDVWVTHIRFARWSTSVVQPRTAAIWTDAGTSPISGTQISLPDIGTQTGWFEVALSQPVKLSAGRYRVGAHSVAGTGHGVGNFFSSGAGSTGYSSSTGSPIVAPSAANATSNAQSCYTDGSSLAKPLTSSGSKALYAVDVLVTDENPNKQVSYGGGSTRSLISASVTGRRKVRGYASTRSLLNASVSGRGKHTGAGSTVSRDTGFAVNKTRRISLSAPVSSPEIIADRPTFYANGELGSDVVANRSVWVSGLERYTTGPSSGSAYLVASNGYRGVNNTAGWMSTPQMSAEYWIKVPNPATGIYQEPLNARTSPGNEGWIFYITPDGRMKFSAGTGTGSGGEVGPTVAPGVIPADTWTHVVGTCDGTTRRIYVNGVLAGTSTGAPYVPPVASQLLRIGQTVAPATAHSIDDVAVYDYALTPEQVQRHYKSQRGQSRSTGSATARTTRRGSQSNAKSLSTTSGSGGRQLSGGGATASFSRVSGRGKALLGGAVRSVSTAVGSGSIRPRGVGRLLSSSLSSAKARTIRKGRSAARSTDTSLGKARTRRYGAARLPQRSTTVGSGVARIVGAAGEPRPHVGMALRLFDTTGALGEYAPDWRSINFTDQLNADGAVTISYVKSGQNAGLLMRDRTEGALFDGAREIPGTRFLVTQQSTDSVSESADGQTVSINAPLWVPTRLAEATVYPPQWPATDVPQTNFGAATPGAIIGTLIARAKARGAILDVAQNFSASVDSNGRPWTKQVTIEIKAGGSIRSVLNTLVEMGVCDWTSNGRELVLKNPESGKDLTTGDNPLVLQAGRDILDAPYKRDATEYFTCVLVEGEDNTIVEVRHPTEYGRRGRIESFVSAGQIRDVGTLRVIGEAHLAKAAIPKTENNHALSLFSDGPQPWIDYKIGDYVYRAVGKGSAPERLRVSQLTFDCTDAGLVTASITLGDVFLSTTDRLNKKIASLTNGSAGTSAPADNAAKDNKPPAKPTGLMVNSNAYTVDNGSEWGGTTMAAVAASWIPVTRNTDGSVLNDLDRYEVRWKVVRT